MYALDTNLLVYAHNIDSPLHVSARQYLVGTRKRLKFIGLIV